MKEVQINLRITKDQKERIKYLAKKNKAKSLSSYIIESCLNLDNKIDNRFKKINTITLNPSVSHTIFLNDELSNQNHYASDVFEYEFTGNGINTSIIINEFHFPTMAIHYSGSFTGEFIKKNLDELNIPQIQIESEVSTTINSNIFFKDKKYHLKGKTIKLTNFAKKSMLRIVNTFMRGEVLALMGEIHEDDKEFLKEVCFNLHKKGISFAFYFTDTFLLELLSVKPEIIFVTLKDLETILNINLLNNKKLNLIELKKSMLNLRKGGSSNVVVSINEKELILLNSESDFFISKIDEAFLESDKSIDAFMGAYLANYSINDKEAFLYGSASYFSTQKNGTLPTIDSINSLKENVLIQKIK